MKRDLDLIDIKIHKDYLLDMLEKRLEYWGLSEEAKELYLNMYEKYLIDGVFSNTEFNVSYIVDNDIAGNCTIYKKDDMDLKDWEKLVSLHKKGDNDTSCEEFKILDYVNYIEVLNEDSEMVLIRN